MFNFVMFASCIFLLINLNVLQAAQFANRIERKFEGCGIFIKRDIQPRGICAKVPLSVLATYLN